MEDYNVRFARGFSLHEALAILEEDDENAGKVEKITIFPPENAAADITDEDTGGEDNLTIDNLPAKQLNAPAEVVFQNIEDDSDFSSDDNLPLSRSVTNAKVSTQKNKKKAPPKKKKSYHWVMEDLDPIRTEFDNNSKVKELESPLELFSKFFDEQMIECIVTFSNKYAQQKNKKPNIEKQEVWAFIGVLVLSGYVQVPRRRIFWERNKDGHNVMVSEAISRDRFEYLFSNLHVCDNQQLDQQDKFTKIRPIFTLLNKKFMEHSIDEAMVPYFGRHGCKQYIHGKPIRYGYKLWVGSTRLGYLNWFEPYQGASTNISEKYKDFGVGAGVVLEYAQALRKKWPEIKFHLFFDNFFTSIPLIEELTVLNFHATGTVRENRLGGVPLEDSKAMKKKSRGSYDYAKISDQNIIAVKWHDNSVVCLCSNFAGVAPIHMVKRYSQKDKKNIYVEQPHLIHLYNANMGGIDRSDQNISLYRVSIRGKKWYSSLFMHSIDMAIQNAWHLHRLSGGDLDQLSFRRRIACALLVQNKKRPSYQKGHASQENDLRYDRLDHLVIPQDKQTRCSHCHQKTTTRCSKCDVGVHVKCFVQFHSKQ